MQFRVIVVTDPPKHQHTYRHDRLQYTAPQLGSAQCKPRLRNDIYCVEWDVKLYYIIPYLERDFQVAQRWVDTNAAQSVVCLSVCPMVLF